MTEPDVYTELCAILKPYEALFNAAETDDTYYLNVKQEIRKGVQLFFGGVRRGKAYISFHLMPVYCFPKMLDEMSPALKKRMQGKSCFNFKKYDAQVFEELKQLTETGLKKFSDPEWLKTIADR